MPLTAARLLDAASLADQTLAQAAAEHYRLGGKYGAARCNR